MITIQFQHPRRDMLTAKLAHFTLDVLFDDNGATLEIYLNGMDYPPNDDSFDHMYLIVDYERDNGMPVYMSVADIVHQAELVWPTYTVEWDGEAEAERKYAEELASPEQAGRI